MNNFCLDPPLVLSFWKDPLKIPTPLQASFTAKNPTQKFILQDFMLAISARKTVPQ